MDKTHQISEGCMLKDATPPRGIPPLLKWPGGKRALLGEILPLVPASRGTYFEPFFGGGAMFFSILPSRAVLADSNQELINCYTQVKRSPHKLIKALSLLRNSEQDYYRVRAWLPTDQIERAARFIYLCTLSFNGIYRVNLKGDFNVPYGRKVHVDPCDEARILATSAALKDASLLSGDFEDTLRTARKGDLVYFDPPYTVAHGLNGFVKYNEKIFSWADQVRLAKLARTLAARGIAVVVSNAEHPSIRSLYEGFHTQLIERYSIISASSSARRQISERVFHLGF
jgi:DNA adenine methylase